MGKSGSSADERRFDEYNEDDGGGSWNTATRPLDLVDGGCLFPRLQLGSGGLCQQRQREEEEEEDGDGCKRSNEKLASLPLV